MADNKVRMTFEIDHGGAVRTVDLTQEMVKIGKHPSSHILIEDDGVSRMHAYVEASATGEVVVMDLGSQTGTFVNGEKVTKKRPIKSGDEIKVGGANIKVWLEGATGASAGTSPGAPKAATPTIVSAPASPAAAPAAAKPAAPNPFAAPAANPFAAGAGVPIAAPTPAASSPFGGRQAGALANPFAAPVVQAVSAADEDEGYEGYYAVVAAGPAVNPSEIESNIPAIEVMVLWGERDILHVSHLSPPRPFLVGEGSDKPKKGEVQPDFRMEASFLGQDNMPVAVPEGAGVAVIVPTGATITVRQGSEVRSDAQVRNGGELRPSSALPGALQYALREGETARVKHKGFVFQVKAVPAALPIAAKMKPDPLPFYYVGAVSFVILGLFGVISFLMPPASMLGGEQLDLNNRYVQALIQAQEQPPPEPEPSNANESEGGSGQAARDASGEMGRPNEQRTGNRSGIQGDAPPEDWRMARSSAEDAARNNVVTNAVASIAAMFSAGPTSEYGADQAVGGDSMSALGNLLGAQIGSSGGAGGLGLVGTGVGGGGTGAGTYGMGQGIGTLGRGGGGGSGEGYGRGSGGLGDRGPVRPVVRPAGSAAVQGGLTADQIRRVIQRNISQVQHCYEQGLQRNPSMAGRVTVAFIISPTGAVQSSSVADNSLGDSAVGSCISGAVRRWAFPQPDPAGVVSVRFPFNLSQSGGN